MSHGPVPTSQAILPPTRPLRVLHLTLAADAGGLTRYITTLGAAMAQRGVEVTAAGDSGAWDWAFEQAPFPYIRIPLKQGLAGLRRSVREMCAWMKAHPVDLIHTHYRRATFLARRLQRAVPVDQRPPILYTLHLSHIALRGWRRWVSDFGDHTHVASRDALDWLVRDARVPVEKISLIPHGIPTDQFPLRTDDDKLAARVRLGLLADVRVVAFVGRLEHPKNAQWCAQVVTAARRDMPNLHLLYAGEGPDQAELQNFAVRERIADRVHFLGHTDPLPVYQAADLLLLPSEREGFSLVCAEAMSVGVPHVRTRTSGTSELTIQNETGVSVEIDRIAFVGAAMRLLGQPEPLMRMGENGARLIREKFTFDRQVDETMSLYRTLVSRNA